MKSLSQPIQDETGRNSQDSNLVWVTRLKVEINTLPELEMCHGTDYIKKKTIEVWEDSFRD